MEEYVIMSPCKDEENYICEWVKYHLDLGFDKIYLYDNNDDSDILPKVLHSGLDKSYVDRVIIYPIPGLKAFKQKIIANFYNKHEFKWCAFIDCDEFITLTSHKNIKDYINSFPQECNQIRLNWLMYGCDKNSIKVLEDEKFCSTPIEKELTNFEERFKKFNHHTKSIVKKKENLILLSSDIIHLSHVFPSIEHQYYNNFKEIEPENHINPFLNINYDCAYIAHHYIRNLDKFQNFKLRELDCSIGGEDSLFIKQRKETFKVIQNNYLEENLKKYSIPRKVYQKIVKLKGKNVLITHEDILPFLLKPGYKITFCGDLKNNNKWINIANFNKCEYKWIKSEFFDQMYTKEDFDFVY